MKVLNHIFGLIGVLVVSSMVPAVAVDEKPDLGPVAIQVLSDGRILLSCAQEKSLRVYSADGGLLHHVEFDKTPGDLAISPSGTSVFLCLGTGAGELLELDLETFKEKRRIACGHSPMSVCFSPDGRSIAVAQRFRNEIWIYAVDTEMDRPVVHSVGREPIDLAWRNDQELVVAHHLSDRPATDEWTGCSLGLLHVNSGDLRLIELEDGSSGARKLALSPDCRFALIPMVIGSHRVPATHIERGWINKNGLSIVNLEKGSLLGTLLLDEITLGAANPWGIVVDQHAAWITLAGTHELLKVDYKALIEKLLTLDEKGRTAFSYDLRGGRQWKTRIPLKGRGPRAVCRDVEGRLLIASYFGNGIERYNPATGQADPLLVPSDPPLARRGEFLFHDADICFQKWMSCSSCHPDARVDAINWDLDNDGLGSSRQAKSMFLTHYTPPTTITGCRPNAEYSVRAGIAFLRSVLPEEDAEAIDEYLSNLKQVPSPELLRDGRLSRAAKAGEELYFGKAGCATCHDGPYLTNMELHDVGSGLGSESGLPYDVPTLREVWRTAPYLYDGRAVSIRETLKRFNPEGLHGSVHQLNDEELDQLIEYVRSL